MATQGVNGLAVAAAGAGILLVWSGLKGARVTDSLRSLLSGQQPSGVNTEPVTTPTALPGSGLPFGPNNPLTGGSPGGSAGGSPASGSESSFYSAVLHDLGAPVTSANLMSMYAWGRREEPGFPPQSVGGNLWNPLNIKTLSGGFAQYSTATDGASATAQFMLSNSYSRIVGALRSGRGLCGDSSLAGEFLAWSGSGYSSVC